MNVKARSGAEGFTLIEIMIVLAVISMLVAMAAFTFISTSNEGKVRSDTRAVSQALGLARMRAIATGVAHGVAFQRRPTQQSDMFFIYMDCVKNGVYNDDDGDPTDNAPVTTWNECDALNTAGTYDPLMNTQHYQVLSSGVHFGTIFGSSAPGTNLEYINFNTLGQATQGSSLMSTNAIYLELADKDSKTTMRSGVRVLGATGLSDIIPLTHVAPP